MSDVCLRPGEAVYAQTCASLTGAKGIFWLHGKTNLGRLELQTEVLI